MSLLKLPISIKFDVNEWRGSCEAKHRERLRQACTHSEIDGQEIVSMYKAVHHDRLGHNVGIAMGSQPLRWIGMLMGWRCSCCQAFVASAEGEPDPREWWEGRCKEMTRCLKDQRRIRNKVYGKAKWPAI